jgi:hypothetical protein
MNEEKEYDTHTLSTYKIHGVRDTYNKYETNTKSARKIHAGRDINMQ